MYFSPFSRKITDCVGRHENCSFPRWAEFTVFFLFFFFSFSFLRSRAFRGGRGGWEAVKRHENSCDSVEHSIPLKLGSIFNLQFIFVLISA